MNQRYFFILLFIASGFLLTAQPDIGFGFRAGLSYSNLTGPIETGPNGEELESYKTNGGFHIGGAVNFKFTDIMGLRLEFLYSQRGTKYEYNGPSYYTLGKNTLNYVTLEGTRHQVISVKNAYIDLPLLGYYRFGKVEIFGGLNSGLLVASTGGGSIRFDGISPLSGNALTPFEISLNHNYKSDEAGGASPNIDPIDVDGRTYNEPAFLGAYYDFAEKDKDLYNTLDFGIVAGLSVYVNEGLFLSARYVHGLGDVDRNAYDISYQSLAGNGSFVQRADKNTSRSWQLSVGFSF